LFLGDSFPNVNAGMPTKDFKDADIGLGLVFSK